MACDCPTAPFLSGPGTYNLTINAGEQVPVFVDWCAQVSDGSIQSSTWAVSPGTLDVQPLATDGTVTSALVTSSVRGELYELVNTVQVLPVTGPVQTYSFTVEVYVAGRLSLGGDPAPCGDT